MKNINRIIHYGGELHGKILHNSTIPPGAKQVGKCLLVVHKDTKINQEYHDTLAVWTRLLSDPELFMGPSIKKKRGLMEHRPER